MSILLTLLILCIIVVLHEWGHFIVAKKSGVLVEEFAVGMGPKLFSVKKGKQCIPSDLFLLVVTVKWLMKWKKEAKS